MKKRQAYRLIAILLPFFFLAVIEGCLRLTGYGYDTRLFVADHDTRLWVMNREISLKYFTASQNATIGNQEAFYKQKPRGTLRFFVLGASSAIGFPYMHNGAFPRMLAYKLRFLFPQNTIEMINVSLTAINTYTLLDFSRQIVDYQPDGILIYAGHNEYYGALGVASSSQTGWNPWITQMSLTAKNLKIVQALTRLAGILRPDDPSLINPDLTLMERMAIRQQIPYESEAFKAGVEQFDRNLGNILRLFQKQNIPVFIGTLAGNLKGQSPLGKEATPEYNAIEAFELGEQAYASDQYTEALQYFRVAKEYDPLRFRAPEVFNEMIRKYGETMKNVHIADVYETFAAHSPNGIIGNELMLEHVHPNLTGQRLIAEAFCDALSKHFFSTKSLCSTGYTINLEDFPSTVFDTIYGDLTIRKLKQQWPFNETPPELIYDKDSFEYKTAEAFFHKNINWGQAMQRLNNHYILRKDYANALRIVEQMILELPHEKEFLRQAGSLSIQLNEKEKAAYYFKQAEKP